MLRFASVAPLVALIAFAAAAAADAPQLIGSSKSWSAFQASTGSGKVCYALARPKTVEPRKAARDPIFFLVSDWPGRKVQGELQVVPGYPYKDGEPVVAQVGSTKVEFFTRNSGSSGAAWVKDPDQESSLLSAMRRGNTITVSGVSERGTRTRDTYSLAGITKALDLIRDACAK
ncbi:MAG: hypothetical protein KGJ78_01700 [Alphaproteobacteria bacterium]|nr:hypothetical protein [Alphaproteobacteria bacterium]